MKTKNVKIKRRILSVMLAAAMITSSTALVLPAFVNTDNSIAADALTAGEWEYTLTDGKATLTKYTGSDTSIGIPNRVGGYPVVKVGDRLFSETRLLQMWLLVLG